MEKGFLYDGCYIERRHQCILWWLFVVNLVLGHLSIFTMVSRWAGVLDHSLAAGQLYHGFNLGRYIEMGMQPGIGFGTAAPGIAGFAIIFFVFMLFVTAESWTPTSRPTKFPPPISSRPAVPGSGAL